MSSRSTQDTSQVTTGPRAEPINYSSLETYLSRGNWREADNETWRVLAKAASKGPDEHVLYDRDLTEALISPFREVDRLWRDYSGGQFGLSVQMDAYDRSDGQIEPFGGAIGWRNERGNWIRYKDVRFDLSAPRGHLPIGGTEGLVFDSEGFSWGSELESTLGFISTQAEAASRPSEWLSVGKRVYKSRKTLKKAPKEEGLVGKGRKVREAGEAFWGGREGLMTAAKWLPGRIMLFKYFKKYGLR